MEEKTDKELKAAIRALVECNLDILCGYPVNQELADKLKLICEGYLEFYKERFK